MEIKTKTRQLRKQILRTIKKSGKGHVGGAFSAIDLICHLYYESIDVELVRARHPNRDRFILSKGHAAIALYVVLQDLGFFSEDELEKMNNCLLYTSPSPRD